MKILNRIKTLYWFWKMTGKWMGNEKWAIQRGEYPEGNPNGKYWMEMWNQSQYWAANRNWEIPKKRNK